MHAVQYIIFVQLFKFLYNIYTKQRLICARLMHIFVCMLITSIKYAVNILIVEAPLHLVQ